MNYQVYTPVEDLQPYVKCFWTLEDEGNSISVRQRVVPDGCMEMIFHYGDCYQQYFEDGTSVIQPKSFVFGQITSFIEISPTGITGIVAARFNPYGLLPFLTIPVTELENKAVNIEDLFGKKGKRLEKEILAASGNPQRIKLIENFLLSLLSDPQVINAITRSCVEVILQSRGQLKVIELADKTNISRRKMERKFISVIGMSPKQLSRVVRLQSAFKMLEQNKFTSLTSLALENGYYDQAHFIKDFKEFTGLSPKFFFGKNLKLATLFAAIE